MVANAHIDSSPLIDQALLSKELNALVLDKSWDESRRNELIKIYQKYQKQALAEIERRLKTRYMQVGHILSRLVADYTDTLLHSLYEFIRLHICPIDDHGLAIIATGGYGRQEMAPFSDMDILFLMDTPHNPQYEEFIRHMLYILWDFKIKLGQSVANIDEVIKLSKEDVTILTTYLDARFLVGDQGLFERFKARFDQEIISDNPGKFVQEKITERDIRHKKMGGSRYLLEPNIKEGIGTLRDMQTLSWLAKYTYGCHDAQQIIETGLLSRKSIRIYLRAYRFFWTVRFWLHMLSGRASEQLVFEYQKSIAEYMGYRDTKRAQGVELFMRHLFMWAEAVGRLSGVVCVQLETQYLWDSHQYEKTITLPASLIAQGLKIQNNMLFHDDPAYWFKEDYCRLIEVFYLSLRYDLAIHPEVVRIIKRRRNKVALLRHQSKAIELMLSIIRMQNCSHILRQMSEIGVLGKFIPYWNVIRWQMQYNMYHHYTTDEHTLRLFDYYHQLKNGNDIFDAPWLMDIMKQVDPDSPVIYLALLLHDIGKGRPEHHSIIGADIAIEVATNFKLSKADKDMIAWLVRHHLVMSDTSARRDLEDHATIKEFVRIVESPIKLRYLAILTACDIKAVGPSVWNHWKSSLLHKLYRRALARINGQAPQETAYIKYAKEKFLDQIINQDQDENTAQTMLQNFPDNWHLNFRQEQKSKHIKWLTKAKKYGYAIELDISDVEKINQVTIIAPVRMGIFSQFSGALAASRVNILDVRVLTLHNQMVLDSFQFTDLTGYVITDEHQLQNIKHNLQKAIKQDQNWLQYIDQTPLNIQKKYQNFHVNGRVIVLPEVSENATVIEVTGIDRPGFLFDITQILLKYRLDILNARIVTYGEKAVDVFYVQDMYGQKITDTALLEQIRNDLLSVAISC